MPDGTEGFVNLVPKLGRIGEAITRMVRGLQQLQNVHARRCGAPAGVPIRALCRGAPVGALWPDRRGMRALDLPILWLMLRRSCLVIFLLLFGMLGRLGIAVGQSGAGRLQPHTLRGAVVEAPAQQPSLT